MEIVSDGFAAVCGVMVSARVKKITGVIRFVDVLLPADFCGYKIVFFAQQVRFPHFLSRF